MYNFYGRYFFRMLLQKSVLGDNLSLSSITTDKFKTGLLSFSVTLENDRLISPYALLLTELLQRATVSYPKKSLIQRKLDELYSASVSIRCLKTGNNRIFNFSAEILDNGYTTDDTDVAGEICRVLYELMLCPLLDENGLFDKECVEQEKRRVVTYLKSAINNPSRYATIRLSEMLRRDDDNLMTLEEMIDAVEKCDAKALTDFYRDSLVGRPIEAFYIGSLTKEQIGARIVDALPSLSVRKEIIMPRCSVYPIREVLKKEEDMPISQGRLCLGFRSDVMPDSEDYYAMVIFNELFGGSPASKLFMNVRERMSLCYSCASYYNPTTGSVRVNSGISPQNREIAESAILEEFKNIQSGKISERELACAKNAVANSYREIYDCPGDIASFYLNRKIFGVNCTIEECREKFSKISADDVVRVANKITLDSVYFLRATGAPSDEIQEEDDE